MRHPVLRQVLVLSVFLAACATERRSVPIAEPASPPAKAPPVAAALEPYSCGTVERLHTWNGIFAGSQPAADDLRHAQENGIRTIVNLRPAKEDAGFDEAALVKELGMRYENPAFASPAELTDAVFDEVRAVLRDEARKPVFLHCHSGNRAGAVWAAFRALDCGLPVDAAIEEGRAVGMKTPALEARVRAYVDAHRSR